MHAAAAADTVVLARSSTVPVVPVILYRYMYTSSGARATFRHHARAEEALQYSSLIATEELTELLKPVVPCPSNIFRCDTRPAKPLDLCLVDLYQVAMDFRCESSHGGACDITGGYRDRAAYFAGLTTRRAWIAMV